MPSRVMDLVAERLLAYRRRNGLTQEETAQRIGCSIPTYRHLEQPSDADHVPDPKLSTLMRIFTTLELDHALLDALNRSEQEGNNRSR